MIGEFLRLARRLDNWLHRHLGRPYHAVLGIGLVIEIVRHVREFGEIGNSTSGIVKTALALILFVVLLIHQLGELYERVARRSERGI